MSCSIAVVSQSWYYVEELFQCNNVLQQSVQITAKRVQSPSAPPPTPLRDDSGCICTRQQLACGHASMPLLPTFAAARPNEMGPSVTMLRRSNHEMAAVHLAGTAANCLLMVCAHACLSRCPAVATMPPARVDTSCRCLVSLAAPQDGCKPSSQHCHHTSGLATLTMQQMQP